MKLTIQTPLFGFIRLNQVDNARIHFFDVHLLSEFGFGQYYITGTGLSIKFQSSTGQVKLCFKTFIFLQAMGKAVSSTMLSMIREIVFRVGFALLLPLFFGLDGVLFSMPVSDLLTAVISGIIIAITYRQLNKAISH